jgi:hypothetical protein
MQVMEEEGYDMIAHGHRSKSVHEFDHTPIDVRSSVLV